MVGAPCSAAPSGTATSCPAPGETSCERSQPSSQRTSSYHANYPATRPPGAISAEGSAAAVTGAASSPCPRGGGAAASRSPAGSCQRVVERSKRSQPAPFKNIARGTSDTASPSASSHPNALAPAGAATPAWVLHPPSPPVLLPPTPPTPIRFKRRITCNIYIFFFLSGN